MSVNVYMLICAYECMYVCLYIHDSMSGGQLYPTLSSVTSFNYKWTKLDYN